MAKKPARKASEIPLIHMSRGEFRTLFHEYLVKIGGITLIFGPVTAYAYSTLNSAFFYGSLFAWGASFLALASRWYHRPNNFFYRRLFTLYPALPNSKSARWLPILFFLPLVTLGICALLYFQEQKDVESSRFSLFFRYPGTACLAVIAASMIVPLESVRQFTSGSAVGSWLSPISYWFGSASIRKLSVLSSEVHSAMVEKKALGTDPVYAQKKIGTVFAKRSQPKSETGKILGLATITFFHMKTKKETEAAPVGMSEIANKEALATFKEDVSEYLSEAENSRANYSVFNPISYLTPAGWVEIALMQIAGFRAAQAYEFQVVSLLNGTAPKKSSQGSSAARDIASVGTN